MKQGDYAIVTNDTSLHGIPIGTKVQLLSVTDDDFKVFYDGKLCWLNEEDVVEPNSIPVNKDLLKKSVPQLFWTLLVELWTLLLLTIARWFMNWGSGIGQHITYRKSKLKKTKKVIGVICPFTDQFRKFGEVHRDSGTLFVQISSHTPFNGYTFDEVIKGPQWWFVNQDTINWAYARVKKKTE